MLTFHLKVFLQESLLVISSDLLESFAACLRLSPKRYFYCVFLGFTLYAAEPGFGPYNATRSLQAMLRELSLHFRSNSAETWPSKIIPFYKP